MQQPEPEIFLPEEIQIDQLLDDVGNNLEELMAEDPMQQGVEPTPGQGNLFVGSIQLVETPNPVFSTLANQVPSPHPDLHRLLAKHFEPVGKPEFIVRIPIEWASFFTIKVLDANNFQWAKDLLLS